MKDLGLALAPKVCVPTNHRPSERSVIVRHLPQEENKMTLFFWTSRFQLLQGMFVQSFAQTFEELTA